MIEHILKRERERGGEVQRGSILFNLYFNLYLFIVSIYFICKKSVSLYAYYSLMIYILQSIRSECETFEYTCNESKKPQNKNLNRYRDVAPYDHTRIILKRGVCDYIHANLIRVNILCKK